MSCSIVKLNKTELKGKLLIDFYETVALKLDVDPGSVQYYSCKSIEYSQKVYEVLRQNYIDADTSKETIRDFFILFAPKVNHNLKDFDVLVGDDFLS